MAKHHERIILPCFNICTFAIFDPYAFRKRSLEYEEDVVCFHDHILPGPAGSVIQKTASGAAAFSGVPFNAILLELSRHRPRAESDPKPTSRFAGWIASVRQSTVRIIALHARR